MTNELLIKSAIAHKTSTGLYFNGKSEDILQSEAMQGYKGKIQLILTSPPFPLNNKKKYGNLKEEAYLEWFTNLAPIFSQMLTDNGSIVIEIGNSWEDSRPVQSLLPLQSLMGFVSHANAGLRLIQEFISYNPSRLPSPAQWVTVNRIRTVDSYTRVWWIAKQDFPKADNSKVLRPYSKSMQKLLERGSYNSGKRPSEHNISKNSFLKDHGGSIAHNFFEIDGLDLDREPRLPNAFSFSNTSSNDFFSRQCKERGIIPHPARMPMGLAEFFIQYLTDPDDVVLDPFAGSNTTGYTAARLGRKWLSIDAKEDYAIQSRIRFEDPILSDGLQED
ncbi:site-specific DNA-methyltransferase [Oryzomonas sagensis]|uniref:Methyltransferase n=1 Tax=Oryzomonas sagensis TaxID=2603857 RepID=A0ABQ6TSK3_9BACT|nr:site-specific DNA-methyltransferase [Oryzomonas sagensis]KAB0671989.1 site-specific DNA-methyltransferase [Oryzomonas sagensis]